MFSLLAKNVLLLPNNLKKTPQQTFLKLVRFFVWKFRTEYFTTNNAMLLFFLQNILLTFSTPDAKTDKKN